MAHPPRYCKWHTRTVVHVDSVPIMNGSGVVDRRIDRIWCPKCEAPYDPKDFEQKPTKEGKP